jgi:hypothetical protein
MMATKSGGIDRNGRGADSFSNAVAERKSYRPRPSSYSAPFEVP